MFESVSGVIVCDCVNVCTHTHLRRNSVINPPLSYNLKLSQVTRGSSNTSVQPEKKRSAAHLTMYLVQRIY